jgi:hypothetical protein
MSLSWLPSTNQGSMVGDYIATAFSSSGRAFPVLAVAQAPVNGVFHEALETAAGGLAAQAVLGQALIPSSSAQPLIPVAAARPTPGAPRTAH